MYEIKVSVICTAYNHSRYIKQCIESILMQKTNFKYELIIHDDASSDGTTEIVKMYADKYPAIIKPIFEEKNQFSKHDGSVKRICDEQMQGQYIALCEGDDYWIDPMKLQKQIDFMEKHPECSLCGTNGLVLCDDCYDKPKYFNNIISSRFLEPKEIIGNWCIPTASIIYRRQVGENFPEWTKNIVHGDLTLQLISLQFGKIYCLADLTCVYRRICGGSILNQSFIGRQAFLLTKLKYLYSEYSKTYNDASLEEYISVKIKNIEHDIAYYQLIEAHNVWKYPFRILITEIILKIKKNIMRVVKEKFYKTFFIYYSK